MTDAEQKPVAENQPDLNSTTHRSKGEKWFDFIFYGPVNFIGAFGLSAVFAVLQKRKAPFIHESMVDGMKKIGIPHAIADASAPVILTSWGGTLMVPILKWAEDSKLGIVNMFNRWTGDKKATPEDLAERPRQTWWSLIAGRLAAMALVWPAMSIIGGTFGDSMKKAEETTGQAIAGWMKTPTHRNLPWRILTKRDALLALKEKGKLSETAGKKLAHILRQIEHHETVPYTFGRMLAVDTFVTAVAVFVLYVTSHFFAKKSDEKKHRREQGNASDIAVKDDAQAPVPALAEPKAEDKPRSEIMAGAVAQKTIAGREGVGLNSGN